MGLGRGLNSLLGSPDIERPNFEEKNKEALRSELLAKQILPPIEKAKPSEASSEHITETDQKKPADKSSEISEEIKPAPSTPDELRIWNLRIDKIKGNKEQPRKVFAEEPLQSLSQSIKEKGVLQPITVRKKEDGEFEIIAGERRWRAAQLAGLQEVPVIIKNTDDATSLELALIENIQRENLNPIEEAEAYFYLIKKYKLTQQELGDKIGKDRATVANVLRMLNLSPDVRKMVANNELSMGQAKAIMTIADPQKQKLLAIKARDLQLSVRAVEKMVAKYKESTGKESATSEVLKNKAIGELKSELQRMIGTKINIDYNQGKGKISISFYGDEELNQIVDKIRDAWKQ